MNRLLLLGVLGLVGCKQQEPPIPPAHAGADVERCRDHGRPPKDPSAGFHRATWSTRIATSSDVDVAQLKLTTIIATLGDSLDVVSTCIRVTQVNKNTAINPSLVVTVMARGGTRNGVAQDVTAAQLDLRLDVSGPRRFENGVRFGPAEASLAWELAVTGSAVEVTVPAGGFRSTFAPPWEDGGDAIVAKDPTAKLEVVPFGTTR